MRFWILRNKILSVYGNTLERLCCRRDYVRIWRVYSIYHPHVFCNPICSHLIFILQFHERYIRQILRILCISSREYDYHLLRLVCHFSDSDSVWYAFLGKPKLFDRQDRVMRNKSSTFMFNVRCVFPFRFTSIFEDENFLLEGKSCKTLKI